MKNICRFLIALMIWSPYPLANAGMIATDQTATTSAQADRAALASALQSLGVDATIASERVAAMTDQEARTLAGEIANAPAGGVYGEGIVAIILITLIIWAWYNHYHPY